MTALGQKIEIFGVLPVGDHHIKALLHGDFGGRQLGHHAAGAKARACAAGQGQNVVRQLPHLRDELRVRVLVGVGVVQSVDVGAPPQQIRAAHAGHHSRKGIVFTEGGVGGADLGAAYRVVLIDHREHPQLQQGLKGVTTETGAGQWGTALSMACAYLGLDCKVYMVKVSYEQKPFRREVMRTYGASVTPSPSETTAIGRKILQEHPGTTGSLGCAISEAVEVATSTPGYRYVLGSVLNQVLLHQSVIGLETKAALDKYNIVPDIIIGCAGGGSNLGGLISPFMGEKLRGEKDYRFIAVEPASCPSFTRGKFAYDFCDTGMVCPLAKMYTLGSNFIPSPNHAGGLRYHGMSSILSQLYHDGYMEAVSYRQTEVFETAVLFAKQETILPEEEAAHAIKGAIDEALRCKETGEEKTILFGLTGTGYFDMTAYEAYLNGTMTDHVPTDEELQKGFDSLPQIPQNQL